MLLASLPEVRAWMVNLLMLLPELLILNSLTYFLVECTQLYYALCLSVIRFIGPSVHLSVRSRFELSVQKNLG